MSPQTTLPEDIETVAVLGAGTIGASWTALFLAAGLEVDVYDPSDRAQDYVADYVATAWPSLAQLGLTRSAEPRTPHFFATPEEAVGRAHFVQESVPERLEVKHDIYRRIEPHLAPQAIVASSASGLMVREMQAGWRDPGRFILAHPFNPPHLIPLVELLANERTADDVLDRAEQFYEACGKVTIRMNKEIPGHVANRLQAALWREAIHLVVEGVASVEDVDKAVWAGPGLRWSIMGPHMLFSLASGGPSGDPGGDPSGVRGMDMFCERYRDSFHRWWDSLGTPTLTPEVGAALAAGIAEEEAGRDFKSLAATRDRKLVAVMKTLRDAEADPA
ncbi:MAG: 3-hydroxyacyl-CoA dehydrogenase NAD-binding domain-containing protein [Kiloniellales bacterium]|nr:3-hydroxyacyl-CoA dehydrogenase NAD-binding domain-containing protein [Kiloniellales bacterium]